MEWIIICIAIAGVWVGIIWAGITWPTICTILGVIVIIVKFLSKIKNKVSPNLATKSHPDTTPQLKSPSARHDKAPDGE